MKTRRLILAAFWLNCLMVNATAQTTPGPCFSGQASYLLAANSGALIRIDANTAAGIEEEVIIFRPQPERGWASQRLLMRFDLKLDEAGNHIVNSGAFCEEVQ